MRFSTEAMRGVTLLLAVLGSMGYGLYCAAEVSSHSGFAAAILGVIPAIFVIAIPVVLGESSTVGTWGIRYLRKIVGRAQDSGVYWLISILIAVSIMIAAEVLGPGSIMVAHVDCKNAVKVYVLTRQDDEGVLRECKRDLAIWVPPNSDRLQFIVSISCYYSGVSDVPASRDSSERYSCRNCTAYPCVDTPSVPLPEDNPWVRIEPPAAPLVLGVSVQIGPAEPGFRPDRAIFSPSVAFEIQSHEVTWRELRRRVALTSVPVLVRWVSGHLAAQTDRDDFPVVGIPFGAAQAYCELLSRGRLPLENEWEYAARGPTMARYPWGDTPEIRLNVGGSHNGTQAFVGLTGDPAAACESQQDRRLIVRSGRSPDTLCDLLGNVREWTEEVGNAWLPDSPTLDTDFPFEARQKYRPLRGLPLRGEVQALAIPMAYRSPAFSLVCGSSCADQCPDRYEQALSDAGFRCARDVTP